MSIFSSAHKKKALGASASRERAATTAPITLSECSIIGLALIRIFVGYLWFQQLSWKMPPTFNGLHPYLVKEGMYTILPGYSYIIQHVFLPNFILLAAGVWTAELLVSLCLIFGIFTRFGALLSVLLSLQLYFGLAFARGEWYWTYGMLVLLGLAVATVPAGRRLGLDQFIAPRLQAAASNSRIARLLSWFV
jgi:thiosulfate dehydrogenase (quinone) large subunit